MLPGRLWPCPRFCSLPKPPPVDPESTAMIADSKLEASRLDFADALRVFLITLVIAHHSVESYVTRHPPEMVLPDPPIPRLWVFLWVNAGFFMGLFFFLAGYFTPGAYDRKGGSVYLRERSRRLGWPLAFGVLLLIPVVDWVRYRASGLPPLGYWEYFVHDFLPGSPKPDYWPSDRRWPELNIGHLWFLEHLLVYAVLYRLWRILMRPSAPRSRSHLPPSNLAIIGYIVALTGATFIVRIWYPQDRWVGFLYFIQMEPAHMPQYVSLFVIGLIAGPRRWLETMPTRRGLIWLGLGAGMGAVAYLLIGSGAVRGLPSQNWAVCAFESTMCAALVVGLPVAFRELAVGASRMWRRLAADVYGVYVFHFPVVMAVQWALIGAPVAVWVRLVATVALAVVISFMLVDQLILRLPGMRRIF